MDKYQFFPTDKIWGKMFKYIENLALELNLKFLHITEIFSTNMMYEYYFKKVYLT